MSGVTSHQFQTTCNRGATKKKCIPYTPNGQPGKRINRPRIQLTPSWAIRTPQANTGITNQCIQSLELVAHTSTTRPQIAHDMHVVMGSKNVAGVNCTCTPWSVGAVVEPCQPTDAESGDSIVPDFIIDGVAWKIGVTSRRIFQFTQSAWCVQKLRLIESVPSTEKEPHFFVMIRK